ncbi:zinc finger MYM-type protein 1-like [Macrobrachium rosenbergii]|uniref:zinc finger MYM-type protein 1-like n=1 Tax=Macrobrachium rosenbergii TaxID=79674 RepID=UPI0034D3EEE6
MNETEEWRAILMRLLDVTLHCASRGLPFQGDNNVIGDPRNGNFLGILELLGKYDRITHEHLAKVKKAQTEGKTMQGQAHYLSWQSQNEFIELCAKKVLSSILDERQQAIYYSIIVDSTPDVAHLEQNVLILRFLTKDDHSDMFEIHERFIEFIMFHKKTGEDIGDMVLSRLDHYKIPFSDCRGQGGSPARWKILKEEIPSSLHSQSDTRWSARVDAVRPVSTHLPGILTALDKSLDNSCMTHEMRAEVRSLKLYFTSYSAIVLAAFWFKVLSSIDLRNKIIQSRGISLESEMSLISDLCAELRQLRDKWADILSEAHHVATSMGIMPRFPGREENVKDFMMRHWMKV